MGQYDLLVIGTGPAGQKAAVQAAKLGKKVGIIERKEAVGGSVPIPAPSPANLSAKRSCILRGSVNAPSMEPPIA
jgi:Pyruvate/2-oxoglutarate dehydrogenase complex, dihydrolipoamide dehydrogenase (E3) component, and related enzymes